MTTEAHERASNALVGLIEESTMNWWEDLPVGYYAVEVVDVDALAGDDYPTIGYITYRRLRTGFRKTAMYVLPGISSPKFDRNRVDDKTAQRWLLDDPNYHRAIFGRFTGRCGCCYRPLTDPDSKTHGIGPECRRQLKEIAP